MSYLLFLFSLSVKHATTFSNIVIKVIYFKNGQISVSVLPMSGNDASVTLTARTRWDGTPYCPVHISRILWTVLQETGCFRRIREQLFLKKSFRLCHFLMEKTRQTQPCRKCPCELHEEVFKQIYVACLEQFSQGKPSAGRLQKWFLFTHNSDGRWAS